MSHEQNRLHRALGMSPATVCGLALLAVPRVVAHDLSLVGPVTNALLVFVPLAVWAAVTLWRRVPRPLVTLLVVGFVYGVFLAAAHQVFWTISFAEPPRLGGNLAGALSPAAQDVILRTFAVLSSVGTGTFVGAIVGVVCWVLARLIPGFRPIPRDEESSN